MKPERGASLVGDSGKADTFWQRLVVQVRSLLEREDRRHLGGLVLLFFLVVTAVGILRPIKNSLALDGLAQTDFYKVYIVSGMLVVFVPLFNWLSRHLGWHVLIPASGLFFAANLVVFRLLYVPGSTTFGLLFYGWYDLFSAALVTQFFLATQVYFTASNAKASYPLVIAGGSLGATLGGGITGLLAERLGTPNLMLAAALPVALVSLTLPLVLSGKTDTLQWERRSAEVRSVEVKSRQAFRNPHLWLIAITVLLTVLVKQLVDYQFNTITREVFGTRDAVTAFQGKFNAATQWLPLVVVLSLRPLLHRWGLAVALLLLPVSFLVSNAALALAWSLGPAVAAKGADAAFRYSAERTGREILYIPVPQELKLRAKTFIDIGVEKGLGKLLSAGLIFGILTFMDYRRIAIVAVVLAFVWIGATYAVRKAYLTTLERSLRGRTASASGTFVRMTGATTRRVLTEALSSDAPSRVMAALALLSEAEPDELRPFGPVLTPLLRHPEDTIRVQALRIAARAPTAVSLSEVRARLDDSAEMVRESAIRTLCTAEPRACSPLLARMLAAPDPRSRRAALGVIASGGHPSGSAPLFSEEQIEARWKAARVGTPEERAEVAHMMGGGPVTEQTRALLTECLSDSDPRPVRAALRAIRARQFTSFEPLAVSALGSAATFSAAADLLVASGRSAVGPLRDALVDAGRSPTLRRNLPRVLERIPAQESVDALLSAADVAKGDPVLGARILDGLVHLRRINPNLRFDQDAIEPLLDRALASGERYRDARRALLADRRERGAAARLLIQALTEAEHQRANQAFRTLALVHPEQGVRRVRRALGKGEEDERDNAAEWLLETVGRRTFDRLLTIVNPPRDVSPRHDGDIAEPESIDPRLQALAEDGDPWIQACVRNFLDERGAAAVPGATRRFEGAPTTNGEPAHGTDRPHPKERGESMSVDIVERTLLFQQVEWFGDVAVSDLASLASVADEVTVPAHSDVRRSGEQATALFVVATGQVELGVDEGVDDAVPVRAGPGSAFGLGPLLEDRAARVGVRTTEACRFLRVEAADFFDFMVEWPEFTRAILSSLARRTRPSIP